MTQLTKELLDGQFRHVRAPTFDEVWAEQNPDIPWPPIGYMNFEVKVFECLRVWANRVAGAVNRDA